MAFDAATYEIDPLTLTTPRERLGHEATVARLLAKRDTEVVPGCWVWTGQRLPKGYGTISVGGRRRSVHRVAYEAFRGPIPDGLHIDHLCRNPSCFNPDHMEAVTPAENIRRGQSMTAEKGRQTHCIRGHEFTAENTGRPPSGGRKCKTCIKQRNAAARASRRAVTVGVVDPLTLTTPRERLLYLRDFLRALPVARFDMSRWAATEDMQPVSRAELLSECGTAACIGGWTMAIFQPGDELHDTVIAAELLGLSPVRGRALFYPDTAEEYEELTRGEAVQVLTHLLNTGEVDWSVAREAA